MQPPPWAAALERGRVPELCAHGLGALPTPTDFREYLKKLETKLGRNHVRCDIVNELPALVGAHLPLSVLWGQDGDLQGGCRLRAGLRMCDTQLCVAVTEGGPGYDITCRLRGCPVCTWVSALALDITETKEMLFTCYCSPSVLPPEWVAVHFSSLFIWDGTFHHQVLWAKLHLGHTVTVTFLGDSRKANVTHSLSCQPVWHLASSFLKLS